MNYVKWLQSRLNAHGAKLDEDGAWGPATRKALEKFRARKKLGKGAIDDVDTVAELRKIARKEPKPDFSTHAVTPKGNQPPWLLEMSRRMGLHERSNKRSLTKWLRIGKFLGDPSKLPWCGDAVETCIVSTLDESVPSNPFWARAWAKFGIDAGGPLVGSIGVIGWKNGSGHVGIVVDYDAKRKRVKLRGGNQGNMVKDSWFALKGRKGRFIAFRWPSSYPIAKYPPIRGRASSGSHRGTR